MSKLVPTCSENQLKKEIFFEFSNVFGTYSNFGRKFLRLLAKKFFRKVVKNCFLQVQEVQLDEKHFFRGNLSGLISELRAKLFLTIGKTSTDRLSKLFSACSGNNVKKQIFHKLVGFYGQSDFKRNLYRVSENSLCKFVKTAFLEFRRTPWSKKTLEKISYPFLSGCDRNVFWL